MVEHISGRAGSWNKLDIIEEHLHSKTYIYPPKTDTITLTTSNTT